MLVAEVATLMDWGEIILPVTPPTALEATASSGGMPTAVAVVRCMLEKRALEEVSESVRNTPSQPMSGAKEGKEAAGLGEGKAEGRAHAGVVHEERQTEHAADGDIMARISQTGTPWAGQCCSSRKNILCF